MNNPSKLAICALVVVVIVGGLLIPIINNAEEEISHVYHNSGDAGLPLVKCTNGTCPLGEVMTCDVSFSIDNEATGPVLRTHCAGFSTYDSTTAPVNQIVFQSDKFCVFVKDNALYVADFEKNICKPFANGTIITVILSDNYIYASFPNFGQYDGLSYLYLPQTDGEYASYRTYSYNNSDPIAESSWVYGDFAFVVASDGTNFLSEGFGMTIQYDGGFPGNGVVYRR